MDIRWTMQRALNALPDENRLATTLYYVDGYSYREIGDFLGVPATTVKGRIQRARGQLRKEMIAMVEELFEEHRLPEGFTEVVVERVEKGDSAKLTTVLVRDKENRGVYLEAGVYAAQAIHMKLKGKIPSRPLGHDFFKRVIDAFEIKLSDVLVEASEGWRLLCARGGKQGTFNALPGDGLALALRCDAAVCVSADIAKAAVPVPEHEPVEEAKWKGYGEIPPIQIGEHVLVTVEKPEAPPKAPLHATPKQENATHGDRMWEVKRRAFSDDSDLILLSVESVVIEPSSRFPFVLMEGQSEQRYLPIGIGWMESVAIAACLPEEKVHFDALDMRIRPVWEQAWKRRSSYDVLKDVLDYFGIEMAKGVIDQLRESTFLAVDFFKRGRMVRKVDARPSDSINLAIRYGCPIFATRAVMEEAGIVANNRDQVRFKWTRKEANSSRRCTVHVGDRMEFRVEGEKPARWTSSDPSVGTVDEEGAFTGLKPGETEIQAIAATE